MIIDKLKYAVMGWRVRRALRKWLREQVTPASKPTRRVNAIIDNKSERKDSQA